jgi:hypothetical protein
MGDLDTVPGVASAAKRRMDDGEFVFTVDGVTKVIQECTAVGIAVLGIEVFPGLNVSTYDLRLKAPTLEASWRGYVDVNNALAEDFIRGNPAPPTSECILTTASWREFCELARRFKFK